MTIEYSPEENPLSEEGKFMARVRSTGTAGQDEIAEEMLKQGTIREKGEILNFFDKQERAIIALLLDGKTVNTGIANFSTSIQGILEDEDDEFDAARHSVEVNVQPGKVVHKAVKTRAKTKKTERIERAPRPKTVIDTQSKERNGKITPGGDVRLTGRLLNFNPNDPNQGVFFHNNGTTLRVTHYALVEPGRVIADAPQELTPGVWQIEVRVLFKGNRSIRNGWLKKTVTVE